jgi:hypothetical protein
MRTPSIVGLEIETRDDVSDLVLVTLALVWCSGQLKAFEVHCSKCGSAVFAGERLSAAITELDEHSWRHGLMKG